MANVIVLGTVGATNVNPYRIDKRIGSSEDEDVFYHLGTALDTTSWTNPSGTDVSITVDKTLTAGGVANMIDRSTSQEIRFDNTSLPVIFKFEFLNNYEFDLASYEIIHDGLSGAVWRDWTVEGSADDVNWDYLHNVQDADPAGNSTTHYFIVSLKNTHYKYIRFRVTDTDGGGSYASIVEMRWWGSLRNDTTGVAGSRIPGDIVTNFTDVDTYQSYDNRVMRYNSADNQIQSVPRVPWEPVNLAAQASNVSATNDGRARAYYITPTTDIDFVLHDPPEINDAVLVKNLNGAFKIDIKETAAGSVVQELSNSSGKLEFEFVYDSVEWNGTG